MYLTAQVNESISSLLIAINPNRKVWRILKDKQRKAQAKADCAALNNLIYLKPGNLWKSSQVAQKIRQKTSFWGANKFQKSYRRNRLDFNFELSRKESTSNLKETEATFKGRNWERATISFMADCMHHRTESSCYG